MRSSFLAFLAMLALSSQVWGSALHKSNILGQDKGPLQKGEESEYELSVSGNTRTVLKNGQEIQTIEETADEKIVKDLFTGQSTIRYYKNGRLMSEIEEDKLTTYSYDSGNRLEKVVSSIAGQVESISWYCYNIATGRLSSVQEVGKDNSTTYYGQDQWFSTSDGTFFEKYERVNGDFVLRQYATSFEDQPRIGSNEQGQLTHTKTKGDITTVETYNALGRLASEILLENGQKKSEITYDYDEDGLITKKTTTDVSLLVTTVIYDKGKVAKTYQEKKGLPIKSSVITNEGSKIETVYNNGKPYAEVTYRNDGKAVASVRYL